ATLPSVSTLADPRRVLLASTRERTSRGIGDTAGRPSDVLSIGIVGSIAPTWARACEIDATASAAFACVAVFAIDASDTSALTTAMLIGSEGSAAPAAACPGRR